MPEITAAAGDKDTLLDTLPLALLTPLVDVTGDVDGAEVRVDGDVVEVGVAVEGQLGLVGLGHLTGQGILLAPVRHLSNPAHESSPQRAQLTSISPSDSSKLFSSCWSWSCWYPSISSCCTMAWYRSSYRLSVEMKESSRSSCGFTCTKHHLNLDNSNRRGAHLLDVRIGVVGGGVGQVLGADELVVQVYVVLFLCHRRLLGYVHDPLQEKVTVAEGLTPGHSRSPPPLSPWSCCRFFRGSPSRWSRRSPL
jgi:hypothetical protein